MAKKDCPQCGGSGWKTVERGGGRVAVRCDCTASDSTARTFERARIPPRYEPCTFANYDLNLYEGTDAAAWNSSLEQAKLAVQSQRTAARAPSRSTVFHPLPPHCGQSFFAMVSA